MCVYVYILILLYDWISPWEKLTINWYIEKDQFLSK